MSRVHNSQIFSLSFRNTTMVDHLMFRPAWTLPALYQQFSQTLQPNKENRHTLFPWTNPTAIFNLEVPGHCKLLQKYSSARSLTRPPEKSNNITTIIPLIAEWNSTQRYNFTSSENKTICWNLTYITDYVNCSDKTYNRTGAALF